MRQGVGCLVSSAVGRRGLGRYVGRAGSACWLWRGRHIAAGLPDAVAGHLFVGAEVVTFDGAVGGDDIDVAVGPKLVATKVPIELASLEG